MKKTYKNPNIKDYGYLALEGKELDDALKLWWTTYEELEKQRQEIIPILDTNYITLHEYFDKYHKNDVEAIITWNFNTTIREKTRKYCRMFSWNVQRILKNYK